MRVLLAVEAPPLLRYLAGLLVMLAGVVRSATDAPMPCVRALTASGKRTLLRFPCRLCHLLTLLASAAQNIVPYARETCYLSRYIDAPTCSCMFGSTSVAALPCACVLLSCCCPAAAPCPISSSGSASTRATGAGGATVSTQ